MIPRFIAAQSAPSSKKGAHLVDDLADMRLACDIFRRQSPDLQIGRVVQLQPAVAAVYRNPFEQIVEGRPPHLGPGIARSLECQPIGHVLVDESEPAERMRRYRQQQSAVVRQMQQLLLAVRQRGEELHALALEGTEIGMLRDPAALAQPFEQVAERRFGNEPFRLEAPQFGKGGIKEFEPLVGVVYRDRCADAFEHLGVRADLAPQLGFRDLDVGAIKSKTDRSAIAARQFDDVEQPPRAADHDMATDAAPAFFCCDAGARDLLFPAALDRG
jgi:hypothetical protein